MTGRLAADITFQDFGIGVKDRNGAAIHDKNAIATFVDGSDENIFPRAGKLFSSGLLLKNWKLEKFGRLSWLASKLTPNLLMRYSTRRGVKRGMVSGTGQAASASGKELKGGEVT